MKCLCALLQVCDLVKFMIEHCQQVMEEETSFLFGGSPRRRSTQETGLYGTCDLVSGKPLHGKHLVSILMVTHTVLSHFPGPQTSGRTL